VVRGSIPPGMPPAMNRLRVHVSPRSAGTDPDSDGVTQTASCICDKEDSQTHNMSSISHSAPRDAR